MADEDVVKRVIAKFGPTLDLQNRPQDLIDILRTVRLDDPDGGLPPGGVPEPPPGPTSFDRSEVRLDDVMAEVLRLSRTVSKTAKDVKKLRTQIEASGQTG
ncbi:hypothetical protein [Microbacterium deminutum]|uniref:Uncharacterized protein n=1 Tax=Microbacterium deminutum TaxID=344164 RepID=A0ABN2QY52_9MICO